jgi:hypothetical protein
MISRAKYTRPPTTPPMITPIITLLLAPGFSEVPVVRLESDVVKGKVPSSGAGGPGSGS